MEMNPLQSSESSVECHVSTEHVVMAPAASQHAEAERSLSYRDKPIGDTLLRCLIAAVCAWGILEIPLEIDPSAERAQVAATFVAKTIWLAAALAAILDIKGTRLAFAFLCGVSIVAITPSLPSEYGVSTTFFAVSSTEIVLKALFLFLFVGQRVVARERVF